MKNETSEKNLHLMLSNSKQKLLVSGRENVVLMYGNGRVAVHGSNTCNTSVSPVGPTR